MKRKICFKNKISKIDQPLAKLTKSLKEKIQMNKTRFKRGGGHNNRHGENPENHKETLYFKNLYSTTLGNLQEMNSFDRCSLPKLNQEHIRNLNRPVTPS